MTKIHVMLLLGLTLSLALFLLCVAGDIWVQRADKTIHSYSANYTHLIIDHYGIWRVCYADGNCKGLDSVSVYGLGPKWLQAVRICVCIAAGLQLIGIVAIFLEPYIQRVKLFHASQQLPVGAFCMLIGMAIYTGVQKESVDNYVLEWGWSFIIGWFSTFFVAIYGCPLAWFSIPDDPEVVVLEGGFNQENERL